MYFHDPLAPIQAHQLAAEFEPLLEMFKERRPRRVLEIGVGAGGTLFQWIRHSPGAQIVAVDWPGGAWGIADGGKVATWKAWATWYAVELTAILADSHNHLVVERVARYAPFDWVFVDGDHSYNGVKADFANYFPLLADDGLMAFHDITEHKHDAGIGVHKFWREVVAGGYEVKEFIAAPGHEMGIGIVT